MSTRGRELLRRARRRARRWAPWALAALGMLWLLPPLWVDWHVDQGFDACNRYHYIAGTGRGARYPVCGGFVGGLAREEALQSAADALLAGTACLALLAAAAAVRRRAWKRVVTHRLLWAVPLAMLLFAGVGITLAARAPRAEEVVDLLRDAAPWSWISILAAAATWLPTRRTLALDDRALTARLSFRTTAFVLWLTAISPRSVTLSWWLMGAGALGWLLLVPAGMAISLVVVRARRRARWSLLPLVGLAAWVLWWVADQAVAATVPRLVPPEQELLLAAPLRDLALLAGVVDAVGALPWLLWTLALTRSLRDPRDTLGLRGAMRPLVPLLPVLAVISAPALAPDPLFGPSLDRAYEAVPDFQPIERPSDAHRRRLGLRAGADRVAAITEAGELVWLGSDPPEDRYEHVTFFPDARVTTTQFLDVVSAVPSRHVSIAWIDPSRPDVGTAADRWPVVRQRLRMVSVEYLDDPRAAGLRSPPSLPEGVLLRDQIDAIEQGELQVDVRDRASVVPTRRVEAGVAWNDRLVPLGAGWWLLGASLGALLGLARWPRRRSPRPRPGSPYRALAPRAARRRADPPISRLVLRRGLVTAGRLALLALACGALGTLIGWLVLAPFGASV